LVRALCGGVVAGDGGAVEVEADECRGRVGPRQGQQHGRPVPQATSATPIPVLVERTDSGWAVFPAVCRLASWGLLCGAGSISGAVWCDPCGITAGLCDRAFQWVGGTVHQHW
jgi:hypothetical protein